MEAPRHRRLLQIRGRKNRRNRFTHPPTNNLQFVKLIETVELQNSQAPGNSTRSPWSIIYSLLFSALFRQLGLWLVLCWLLSYFHLGASCYLLAMVLLVYSGPVYRALIWAQDRLYSTVIAEIT